MIYFEFGDGRTISGYVGDDDLVYNIKTFGWERVHMVQADGDELQWIKNVLTGLRMSNRQVVRWCSDDAKFIAVNWFSIGG